MDFKKTLPNILFNLSPKSTKVLLDRLDKDDPKYQFRSRNIKGGFNAAQSAIDLLPKNLQEIVVDIDCSEDERVIHNREVRSLGRVGLGSAVTTCSIVLSHDEFSQSANSMFLQAIQ